MKNNFHPACPILRVDNVKKSITYFEKKLGFKLDWNFHNQVASVSRMKCNIMIAQGDQGKGKAWVYVGIRSVDQLYQEYKKSRAKIRQKPTNFEWAYEMQVEDLDGNVIRFGSEPKKKMKHGPWMDMKGKLWI